MSLIDDLLNSGRAPKQDFVLLGGKKTPGFAVPTGAGTILTWDKQKGWGYTGASLLYTGQDLSDFDVQVVLWDDRKHWKEWDEFARVLEKPALGKVPPALDIRHPLINRVPWRIEKVVLRGVGQPEQLENGMWTIRIGLTDWRARKPVLTKVEGVPKPGTKPPAEDPEIAALLAEQARLGGVL